MSNPVSLTEVAARRVREIMESKEGATGIRISVEPKGCMGLSYVLGLTYETDLDHSLDSIEVEDKGIKICIDKRAYDFVSGTVIDFTDDGLGSQFIFANPNAKNKCVCGNSFCV